MADVSDNTRAVLDQALLSWIQQSAPYGIIILDSSLNIQGWNAWMELHSGAEFKVVAGKNFAALYPDLKTRNLFPRLERALLGESSIISTALHNYFLPFPPPARESGFEFMRQTARINPLLSGKSVCGIVIVIEDVTQRESQSEDLRWQHRRDEMLSSALGQLLKAEEPRGAIRQLFFRIAEHLELDTFLLYLNDGQTLKLHISGGVPVGMEEDFRDCPFHFDGESESSLIINPTVSSANSVDVKLHKSGITAAIVIPLYANKRLVGAVCFASTRRKTIEADEAELLKIIAQHLATAIDRQDTSHELQKTKEVLSNYSQQLEKRVDDRTSRLQETVSELEMLSYTMAHDLKAPLRGLTGYCNVLLTDFANDLPSEGRLIVNRLLRNAQRMEGLIRDLLAFSQISQNEVALTEVDVLTLLRNIVSLRLPEVRQAISIRGKLHNVTAHKALLEQILSNLIDNAIKFVEPNTAPKITIFTEAVSQLSPSTRSRKLIFSSVPSANPVAEPHPVDQKGIRIWVVDEGIGMQPEIHQKIFGVFERGAAGQKYEGNGIGLAIVARAVQRMGGTFGVESQLGKGSQFWIEFPA